MAMVRDVVRMPSPSIEQVTLVLDGEEASVLKSILQNVGGSPTGRRVKANSILRALEDAGVEGGPLSRGVIML